MEAQPLWKTTGNFLYKFKISYNPEFLFLDTYPREIKTYIHTKT